MDYREATMQEQGDRVGTCTRCGASGVIREFRVEALDLELFACLECKTVWPHEELLGSSAFVDLDLFLQSHGLTGGWTQLSVVSPSAKTGRVEEMSRLRASDDHIAIGIAFLASGLPQLAMEHFEQVLRDDPSEARALQGAIDAAHCLGDEDKTQQFKRRLVEQQDPGRHSATGSSSTPGGLVVEDLSLADVAGMEHVKRRLNAAFLAPARNPELGRMFGTTSRGGLLLFGARGCGKTFIAKALAGELGATFFHVGLSDILDMWLGESERKLHEVFEEARRSSPSLVFFDEIDAIGQKRSQLRLSPGARTVVSQLLVEFDGVGDCNEGVFVLGATNHPWDVDEALNRPGRFDRALFVLPPDEPARRAILTFHLQARPVARADLDRLARKTDGFSGADLAHMCSTAAELALAASVDAGEPRPIEQRDLDRALQEVKPSTRAWFDLARNYAIFANQDGMYDDLMAYMRVRRMV